MIQLTKDYWKNFKQDGQLFEKLVGELLHLEYPGKTFKKTKATHDGNRDWELNIPLLNDTSADIWFECKYHKNTLAAEEVAMTLVMAYVEDARQIVFFSYSPVNREFTKKISRFSERSKIPVFIYDDTALESLILRHWNNLDIDSYFPDAKPHNEVRITEEISAYCEVCQNGHRIFCHKKEDFPVIRFNDLLELRITLVNHSSSNKTIQVSFDSINMSDFWICNESFLTTEKGKDIYLSHNSIGSFLINLRPRNFGPKIKLPTIVLDWENEQKKIYPGVVEGQWLAETSLIGQEFQDIVFSQSQFMRKNSFSISQVMGCSGVGKSRLTREVITQAYICDKQIFSLDTELNKLDALSFVRELISCLEGLPSIPIQKDLHVFGTDNNIQNMTMHILYDDIIFSQLNIKELANYLFKLMQRKEIWLIIDNAQWLDEGALELLDNLMVYVEETSHSGIFLTFNYDYLYSGTKAEQLMKSIDAHSSHHHGNMQSVRLDGFTYSDALSYLKECLTYHTNSYIDNLDYEQTLMKIIDHCGTQPFYLQNMLIYLSQKHVLERTNKTSFYLTSISDFWKYVKQIPQSVIALLEKRIESAREYFIQKDQQVLFDHFCMVLSFCGNIPAILVKELFGAFPIKRELMNLGLIFIESNGCISFFHQYFEQYFQKIYPIEEIPKTVLENFCIAVDKRKLTASLLEPYYLSHYALGTCKLELLQEVMNKLVNWKVLPQLSRKIKQTVLIQLDNVSEQLPDRLVASCYYNMCFMTANREGMHEACLYYEKCYLDLLDGKKAYLKHTDMIFPLLREYMLSLGNLNQNQMAIDRAEKILPYVSSKAEYCTIREILCISNYAMGKTTEAIWQIQDALEHSVSKEDQIKLMHEFGKTYYYSPNAYQYRKQMCEQWDNAFSLYFENEKKKNMSFEDLSSLQRDIAAWLNSGISDLVKGDILNAEKKMTYLSQFLDHSRMPFYEIKIRFFKSSVLLLKDMFDICPGRSHKEICDLLNQAGDICVVYYNMQDYPICFYLRASAQIYAGRYEEAIDSYTKTCTIIQKTIDNIQEESIWSYFYEDMALRFVQLHEDFPQELLFKIHSKELRNRIQKIGKCKSLEQELVQCNRSPILFTNSLWGLPKI